MSLEHTRAAPLAQQWPRTAISATLDGNEAVKPVVPGMRSFSRKATPAGRFSRGARVTRTLARLARIDSRAYDCTHVTHTHTHTHRHVHTRIVTVL